MAKFLTPYSQSKYRRVNNTLSHANLLKKVAWTLTIIGWILGIITLIIFK